MVVSEDKKEPEKEETWEMYFNGASKALWQF